MTKAPQSRDTTDVCDLSASQQLALLRDGRLSASALLEASLARIADRNPALNAVVALDESRARKAAAEADAAKAKGRELGPLHGLVLGIKDSVDTQGLVTTSGSLLYKDYVPAQDHELVRRLRAAGAIILAKTNLPEFGTGANTFNAVYGATGNPYDPDLTCGGSSGGSAVALATGMVSLATGSDLGGSLRTPAGFCGVVGFRPEPGAIGNPGGDGWEPLAVKGPMGRSVEDCALLYDVMVGPHPDDPLSMMRAAEPLGPLQANPLSDLRVGYSFDLGFAPVSQAVRDEFQSRLDWLAPQVKELTALSLPLAQGKRTFEVLRGVGYLGSFDDLVRAQPEMFGPNVIANVDYARGLRVGDVAWAQQELGQIYSGFRQVMDSVDVLLAPVAAVSPFPKSKIFQNEIDGTKLVSYIDWIAITYGLTLTCHPVMALPAGSDQIGLPFGIQVVGKARKIKELFNVCLSIQAFLGVKNNQ